MFKDVFFVKYSGHEAELWNKKNRIIFHIFLCFSVVDVGYTSTALYLFILLIYYNKLVKNYSF